MVQPKYILDRRGFLRVSAGGVIGTSLSSYLLNGHNSPAFASDGAVSSSLTSQLPGFGRAKSVLIVLLSGGPSQLDMWDPKPESPSEVRGEFSTIPTKIPGVAVCEHLPQLGARLDRWSLVRTLAHREHNHLLATHVALTGRPTPIPRGGTDLDRVESRNDFPNFAAALDFIRPRNDGIPSGVTLPNYLIEGPLTWPGQHAGFLGPKHDPWQIQGDPNDPAFRMQALSLKEGVTKERIATRRELLDSLNRNHLGIHTSAADSFREQQQVAIQLLTSGKMVEAFDIHRDTDEVRERYGRNQFGQSLLLAKRLVAAGVPIVQATMGIVQTWDTHVDNWGRLKKKLLPDLDRGLAALMDDLQSSGLLEETLVIVMGEFGRTPKISTLPGESIPGRDHWAHAYSGLFAGAGVQGGQVIGQTDALAAYPLTRAWSPADICSTIFHSLGVDQQTTIQDPLQRAHFLCNGAIMTPLYTGSST